MKRMFKPIQHILEYILLKFFMIILYILPVSVIYKLGKCLGRFIYYIIPFRKKTAIENIKRALGNKSDQEINLIIKKMYENFSYFVFESIIMPRIRKKVDQDTIVEGEKYLRESFDLGKGVVFCTAHIGNWHVMGQKLVDLGFPINNIVKRQRNALVFGEEVKAMEKAGMKVTIMQQTPKNILKAFNQGDVVEFLCDQDAGDNGVFVDFFGYPASTVTGPALFSIKLNAPIIFCVDVRINTFTHKIFLEKIECKLSGNLDEDIKNLTQYLTKRLEQYIIDYPEQYFWLHKRWNTQKKV
jgi:Kdo2-lipid IVA lauroyltransferase/acyltransferase